LIIEELSGLRASLDAPAVIVQQNAVIPVFERAPFDYDCIEDFDVEQAVEFLSEELFSLFDCRVNDGIAIRLKRNRRTACFEQVLVNMKSGPEHLHGRFETLYRVFLGLLVEALIIHASHFEHKSKVPTLCEEDPLIPKAIEIDVSVKRPRFLPWLDYMCHAQHHRTSTAGISCLAASYRKRKRSLLATMRSIAGSAFVALRPSA